MTSGQSKLECIPHRIKAQLGAGQFGMVHKGHWQASKDTQLEVAVKMLRPGASEGDVVKFLQEAAINGQFHHPNVVKLLGVVTVGNPVSIFIVVLGVTVCNHVGNDRS